MNQKKVIKNMKKKMQEVDRLQEQGVEILKEISNIITIKKGKRELTEKDFKEMPLSQILEYIELSILLMEKIV